MATKKQLIAAVQKRYGKNAYVEHNPRGLDKAQRDELRAWLALARSEVDRLGKEIKAAAGWESRLIVAAQFVCDVSGDDPSIPALQAAVEQAARIRSALVERRDLQAEIEKRKNAGPFQHGVVEAVADTADELLQKLKAVTN
jgi:hypothetical protein